ncbi:hypothetical protein [Pseudovibrio sp. Alg231-02]|uniref:hypothetical protein n=1 Tax=Pseudovibrio sp. Alg231-02 TaxID=1922223 RepID=UPI000D5529F8|nr:hypothetical protein [Pseudovibrio sp. Alg231-02]
MPENNLPPEHENWAHAVLKTMKVRFDLPDDDQVPNSENGQGGETVSVSQAEQPPQDKAEEQQAVLDLAERKRIHQKELSKVSRNLKSLAKAVHIAGKRTDVFIEDVTQRVFEDAKQLAEANVKQANDIMNKPDKKGFVDLGKLQAFMDRGEEYLRVMQSNFKEGQDITLDSMRGIAAEAKKKLDDVHKQRASIETWNIDLSRFDGAYEQAAENIRDLNTALNSNSISVAKQSLQAASINLAVLKDLLKKTQKHAANAKKDIENRVQSTETAAADLSTRKSEIEHNPKDLVEFEKLHEAVVTNCKQATSLVAAGNGIEAEKAAESAENGFIEMQQVMLQSIASSEGTPEEDDDDENEVKLLAGDAIELTKKADELASQEGLVSEYNGLLPVFRKADKSARSAIAEAQSDLLKGEVLSAEDKLEKVKLDLTEMHEIAVEAQSALEIAQDQIALLQKQADILLSRRSEFVKFAEVDERKVIYLKRFDTIAGEVEFNLNRAETAVKNENLSEANQVTANAQTSITNLQNHVDKLQYFQGIRTAATQEENTELFMQTLDRLRENIAEFNDRSDVFKDKEEEAIFDNLYDRAVEYSDQAENLFKRKKYEDADDAIDNTQIALSGLEIALERGAKTAAKVAGLKIEVQEAWGRIQAYENVANGIVNDELRGEFLSFRMIAQGYAKEAFDYISQGRITDARGALADLKQSMVNLDAFVANPPKPKQPESYQAGTETSEVEEEALTVEQLAEKEEQEEIALFVRELKQLRVEVEQLKNAVKEGNKVWERFCEGDYLQRFQNSFQLANASIDEAMDWLTGADQMMTPGPRMKVNQDLFITSIREPITEAKKAYRDMENAFDVSKQIVMSQLNGISEGAKYYLAAFEDIYKLRDDLGGWAIDLSALDDAYLTAMDNIAELKISVEKQDVAASREALDLAETHRQSMRQASEAAEKAALDEELKVITSFSDLLTDYIKLSELVDTVAKFPEILKVFENADATARAGLDKAHELAKSGEGKAAVLQFSDIAKAMDVMVDALGDAGVAAVRAELDAQAQRDADITVFGIQKEEILAEVETLSDIIEASYSDWIDFCRGDFEASFNDYFESAKQKLENVIALSNPPEGGDVNGIIAKMKHELAEAQSFYKAMDGIHNVSESIATFKLRGMNQRAEYFQDKIDKISEGLNQYVDWDLDFSEFDVKYNEAKGLIEKLRGAVQKKDYINGVDIVHEAQAAVDVVDGEVQRYADLFVEAKANFYKGFGVYRERIAELVKRRPELENIKHLATAFDDAERSALQAIDRAIALIRKGDRFGPDKESEYILSQEDRMLELLQEAVPLAKDPEKLAATIKESQQKLAEFEALKKDIQDGMDREVFEAMQVRGAEHAAEAQKLMEQENFEKAEFELFALRVVNEALQSRHDSGVAIADKIPELEQEVEDVTTDLDDLNKLSSTIQNADDAVNYGKYHSIGIRTAFEAKDFLLKDEIRRAQAALNTLQYYLDKMEELLDKQGTKGPKRRSGSVQSKSEDQPEETLKPSEELELEREDSFGPADDEEQKANLQEAIASTDQLLETAKANVKDLLDASEAEYYGMILQKAEEHAAAAKDHLANARLDDGDESIEYLKFALDTLHDAHRVGLATSQLVPGYEKEIDEIGQKLILLNLKRNTISEAKAQTEFDKVRNEASASVYQVARLLNDKNIRKVKYEMDTLREKVGNLEKILNSHTSRRAKLKNLLKRKK